MSDIRTKLLGLLDQAVNAADSKPAKMGLPRTLKELASCYDTLTGTPGAATKVCAGESGALAKIGRLTHALQSVIAERRQNRASDNAAELARAFQEGLDAPGAAEALDSTCAKFEHLANRVSGMAAKAHSTSPAPSALAEYTRLASIPGGSLASPEYYFAHRSEILDAAARQSK